MSGTPAVAVKYAFAETTYLPAAGIERFATVVSAAGSASGPFRNREFASVGPIGPAAPAAPAGPAVPAVPAGPARPRGPVGPRKPRGPRSPRTPAPMSTRPSEPLTTWAEPTLFDGSSASDAA